MEIQGQDEIKIDKFEADYMADGYDRFLIDIKFDKFCQILDELGWERPYKVTNELLKGCVWFVKQVEDKKVMLYVRDKQPKTTISCREWWSKECVKYFNLKNKTKNK